MGAETLDHKFFLASLRMCDTAKLQQFSQYLLGYLLTYS